MYNEPEWASEEEWNAYAWFGFAISEAQTVERQLLLIAVAIKNAEAQSGRSENENLWFELRDKLGRRTLGQLRNYLEPYGVLDDDVLEMLKRAVAARNALAHEFFVPQTANGSDRSPIVAKKELQKAASLFSHLSTRLELVLWPLIDKLHIQRRFSSECLPPNLI